MKTEEEIKYYKEKEYPLKWIPAEEMEETPQQTIARLEQENKELKALNKKICEDWEKEIKVYWNAFEEIRELVRADCKGCTAECDCDDDCTRYMIKNKINEVLNEKEL